jgi:hypothetical protein
MSKYFSGVQGTLDADMDLRDAWLQNQATLKETGNYYNYVTGQVEWNTDAKRKNVRSDEALVKAVGEAALAEAVRTSSVDAGLAKFDEQRQKFIDSRLAMNWSQKAAEDYADKLGLTRGEFLAVIKQSGMDEAIGKAKELQALIDGLAASEAASQAQAPQP